MPMKMAGTCHWKPSQSNPLGSRVKLALVVTVTVLVTVDGAAVTVNEHVAVLDATVNSVVGVLVVDVVEVGDDAETGTVRVVPETESATELPVVEATTVGTETPESEEERERVVTAEAVVLEKRTEDVVAVAVATAVKSSTAETLRPLPMAMATRGAMLMVAAVTTQSPFKVRLTGLVMLRRVRQPRLPVMSDAEKRLAMKVNKSTATPGIGLVLPAKVAWFSWIQMPAMTKFLQYVRGSASAIVCAGGWPTPAR